MSRLEVYLFGTFRLHLDGRPLPLPSSLTTCSLLAYLLYYHNKIHSRISLIGHFWPDRPEQRARRALTQALWQIRGQLPDLIIANREHVQINPDQPLWLDVHTFQNLTNNDATTWREALDLYTAVFLDSMYDDWQLLIREQLRERYLGTCQRLVQIAKQAGNLEQALVDALSWSKMDPLDEASHQEVMRLYAALNRPTAAQKQFELCRQILANELDVTPTEDTIALAEAIAKQQSATTTAYVPPGSTPPPVLTAVTLPLVGREAERQALLGHLEAALAGVGGVILIKGMAGVGKSRLLQALAEDASWRGAQLLWGTATADIHKPYQPLLAGLIPALTPLRLHQLRPFLADTWLSTLAPLFPVIQQQWPDLSLLPDLPAQEAQARLHEAFVHLLLVMCQRQPIVLLLEDLHWADIATWSLLALLARRATTGSLLLVATYREDDLRDDPDLWTALQTVIQANLRERLALMPLNQIATGELIRQGLAMGQVAHRFAARIQQQTAGNPFFVLETLRALHEEGILQRNKHGQWQTPFDNSTKDYGELVIPPSVQMLIERRLSRLTAVTRQTLAIAAAIGNEVEHQLLVNVSRLPTTDLMASITELVNRHFLIEHAQHYQFQHDMVRQVVYEALSLNERQQIHHKIALALAASDNHDASHLAYHYDCAHQAADAIRAYQQAGQQAMAIYDLPTALAAFNRALTLLRSELLPPDLDRSSYEFQILNGRLAIWRIQAEAEAQAADLDALYALLNPNTPPVWQVETQLHQSTFLRETVGDYAAACQAAQEALKLAQAHNLPALAAQAQRAIGQAHFVGNQYSAAAAALRQALTSQAQLVTSGTALAEIHLQLVYVYRELGELQQAQQEAESALALIPDSDLFGAAQLHNALTWLARARGDHQAELGHSRQVYERMKAIGHRYFEGVGLNNMALAQTALGDLREAMDTLAQALIIFREMDRPQAVLVVGMNLGSRYMEVGRLPEAQELYKEMLAVAQHLALTDDEVRIRLCLAVLHTNLADFEPAKQQLVLAENLLTQLEAPFLQATYQYRAGQLYLAQTHYARALHQFEQAEADYGRSGWPDYAVNMRAYQAICHWYETHQDQATRLVTEAYEAMLIHPSKQIELPTCYYYWQIMHNIGHQEEAWVALNTAVKHLERQAASLGVDEERPFIQNVPLNQAIMSAWRSLQPETCEVLLPREDAPYGRSLTPAEQITVTWTVATPDDETITPKAARRRHRIHRLLDEAAACGAAPAYHHLADTLHVSERTIARDMAALRHEFPHLPPTRR